MFAKNHRAFLDVTGHSQYHEPTLPLNLCRIMAFDLWMRKQAQKGAVNPLVPEQVSGSAGPWTHSVSLSS